MSDDLLGRRVGRFHLLEKIGEGGMGVVFRGHDPDLARDVAVKVLARAQFESARAKRRILREARAAAAVLHPSIATIFEVGEEGETLFLVMELVEGDLLADRLARGPMEFDDVIDIAKQIADALVHAHEAGIVHRDIKPENVMLDSRRRVKILDFGVAKALDQATTDAQGATLDDVFATIEGRVVGTPAYMSPEQAQGQPVDRRSDLFSLGSMLYEMLTGHVPFERDGVLLTLSAVVHDAAPPISAHREGVPVGLGLVVERLMAKDPAARFGDANELLDALHALEARPSMAVGPKSAAPVEPRARVGLVIAALVIGALGVAAGLAAWSALRETPPPAPPADGPGSAPPAPATPMEERRLTANPAERWIMAALPAADGALVFQDETGIFRLASAEDSPTEIALPEGVEGPVLYVFADGRLLLGAAAEGGGPLTVVDGDAARELTVSALWATVTPDERRVVFTNPRGVFVAPLDGGEPRRIGPVGSDEQVEQLTCSPDGTRVAYIRVSRRADDAAGALQVVTLDGASSSEPLSGPHLLQTGAMTGLTWRDDARLWIALFGDASRPPVVTLHEIVVDGISVVGEPRPVHVFQGAAGVTDLWVSARGMIFTKLGAQADVQVAELTAESMSAPTRLTASDLNDRPCDVDAEGRVIFTSDRRGSWDLYRQRPDEDHPEPLTSGPELDTYGRVAPDGGLVFFRLAVAEGGVIERASVMRLDEGDDAPRELFVVAVEDRVRPGGRPPPEAARLRCGPARCFVSSLVDEHLEIESFDPASGAREPLLTLDAPQSTFDWDLSPDEQTLALVLGGHDLELVPVAEPTRRTVTSVGETGSMASLAWSPDGSSVVATGVHIGADRYVILRVDLDGQVERLWRSTHTYFAHPAFSADGRTLVFGQQNFDVDVWRLEGATFSSADEG